MGTITCKVAFVESVKPSDPTEPYTTIDATYTEPGQLDINYYWLTDESSHEPFHSTTMQIPVGSDIAVVILNLGRTHFKSSTSTEVQLWLYPSSCDKAEFNIKFIAGDIWNIEIYQTVRLIPGWEKFIEKLTQLGFNPRTEENIEKVWVALPNTTTEETLLQTITMILSHHPVVD